MKRVLCLVTSLLFLMTLSLAGCGSNEGLTITPGGGTVPDPGGGSTGGGGSTESTVKSVSILFGSSVSVELAGDGSDAKALVRALVISTSDEVLPDVTVSFFDDSGLGTFSAASATTGVDGLAQVDYIAGSVVGTSEIYAVAGGVVSSKISAALVPGAPAEIVLSAESTTAAFGDEVVFQATVRDQADNAIPSAEVEVVLSDSGGNRVSSVKAEADTSGVVSLSLNMPDVTGTYGAVAKVGTVSSNVVALTVIHEVAELVVEPEALFLPSGAATATVSLKALDRDGLPVSQIPLSIVSTGNAVISNQSDTVTDGLGAATFDVTDAVGENSMLQVTCGTFTTNIPVYAGGTVTVTPPLAVTADGTSTSVLQYTFKDFKNRQIAELPVDWAVSGGAVLEEMQQVTGTQGQALASLTDQFIETVSLELWPGVYSGTLPAAFSQSVSFVSGVAELEFEPSSLFLPAGSTAVVKIRALDADGAVVDGELPTVTAPASVGIGVSPGVTDGLGETTFAAVSLGSGNDLLAVTCGNITRYLPVYSGGNIAISQTPSVGVADGSTPVSLLLAFKDYLGQQIADLDVLAAVDSTAILDGNSYTTDALGQVQSRLTAAAVGSVNVTLWPATLTPAVTHAVTFSAGAPGAIELTTTSSSVSLGGALTLTATVFDASGNPVKDGTVVEFSSSNVGSVSSEATTLNGVATANFEAGLTSGSTVITATSGGVETTASLNVQSGTAGIIEVATVTPTDRVIHISGSEAVQDARITFRVKDGSGNNVVDGTSVSFALPGATVATVAAGGEAIATSDVYGPSATGTTVNGLVSVSLRSGNQAKTVGVVASINSISTEARVTIVGGLPDSAHFSLALEKMNVAGGVTFGLQNTVTAFLGDRFSNVPIDGTPVSFYSECGTIGDSSGFTASTEHGQASTHVHTQLPTTPNLRGLDTDGDSVGEGNVGLCTIIAATPGEEYFVDNNGNGTFDSGTDTCSGDQGEPYIDGNDNGQYDLGEFYVDSDANGVYTVADGTCSSQTMIWTEADMMVSSYIKDLNLIPSSFSVLVDGSRTFVFDFADIYGNALTAGSTVTVEADAGVLAGVTSYSMPDSSGMGYFQSLDITGDGVAEAGSPLTFALFSEPVPDDLGEEGSESTYEYNKPVTLKITVEAPDNGGSYTYSYFGTVNSETINTSIGTVSLTSSAGTTLTANGTDNTTVTVTVLDTGGAPIAGEVVTFTAPGDANMSLTSAMTDNSGRASVVVTAPITAGSGTLRARVSGESRTLLFDFVPGPPAYLQLDADPTSIYVRSASTITATLKDANNNLIANTAVNFSVPTNDSGGTIPAVALSGEDGTASVVYYAGNLSGTDVIQATEPISGLTETVNVTVSPQTGTRLVGALSLVLGTSVAPADGSTQILVRAAVQDTDGEAYGNYPVVFSTDLGAISGTTVLTNVNGYAETILVAPAQAGTATIRVNAGGAIDSGTITFTAGTDSVITVTPTNNQLLPGETTDLLVKVRDGQGNVSSNISLRFEVTGNVSGGVLSDLTATTDVNGEAVISYTAGSGNGADTITVFDDVGNFGVTTLTVSAKSFALYYDNLTNPFPPAGLSVGSGSSTRLYVKVTDSGGNGVEGADVNFAFLADGNQSGAILSSQTATTDASGVASVYYYAGATANVSDQVTVTAASITAQTADFYVTPLVSAIAADREALLVPTDGSTDSLTLTLYDQNALPLANTAYTLTAQGNAALGAYPATTDALGQATFSVSDVVIENTTVTITSGGLSREIPVYAGGALVLTPATGSGVADGVSSVEFTATLRDGYGVVIPDLPVSFSADNRVSLAAGSVTTNASGQATIGVSSRSTASGVAINASSGALTATSTVDFVAGDAAEISLAAGSTSLSLGASTTLTATVLDQYGNFVADNTKVLFSIDGEVGTVSSEALTTTGVATVTFEAGLVAGTATVIATSGTEASVQMQITVQPGSAGVIEVASIDPSDRIIHVSGTEGVQVAKITFSIKDSSGNPVADGTSIDFTLPSETAATVADGGAAIASTGVFGVTATASTVNGLASVSLRSGKHAKTVGVVATYTPSAISTEARVTIAGGIPDSAHFSLSAEYLNMAGGVTFGLQDTITAYLGDRYSNVPIDGTPVSFYSECGTIGDSTGFTVLSEHGQAVTHLHTMDPTTPNLRGVDVDGNGVGDGNPGYCTLMAMSPGSEYFQDNNDNGIFDAGDGCPGDQPEPYIDGNDNGQYDVGEFYIDVDRDGVWDDVDNSCSSQTMIWTSMRILMSSYSHWLNVTPASFNIPIGGSQVFDLDVADIFGNALVAGSTLTISADGGKLSSDGFTMADTVSQGFFQNINTDGIAGTEAGTPYSFALYSDIEDTAEPQLVTLTITLNPTGSGSQGSNGAADKVSLIGYINDRSGLPVVVDTIEISTEQEELVAASGTSTVRAKVLDSLGDGIQGVTVTFASQGGTFSVPAQTDPSGITTAVFTAGGKVGEYDLVAASGGVSGKATITVVAGTPLVSSVNTSPSTVAPGSEASISARVTDASGNPITGENVTFSVSANNSDGSLATTVATTDDLGLATVAYTAGNSLSSASVTDTITATVGSSSLSGNLTVSSSSLTVGDVTLTMGSDSLTAGSGATTNAFTVVSDKDGNPLPGVEVYFSAPLGATVAPASVVTDAGGLASATVTVGTTAGSGQVRASAGGTTAAADITFTPGAPSVVTLTAAPSLIRPTGSSTAETLVKDANGNVVSDTLVSFVTTNNTSGASLDSSYATTDASGFARVTYTAGNGNGTDTITATAGSASDTATVQADSTATVVGSLTLASSAAVLPADGSSTITLQATVLDDSSLAAPGMTVTFAVDSGTGTLLSLTANTNSSGVAQVVYRASSAVETAVLSATISGFTKKVVISQIDPVSTLLLTVDDLELVADGAATTTLTVTAADRDGSPVSGVTVNFSTNRGSLSAPSAVTVLTGQASVTLTADDVLGTALITASYGSLMDSEAVTFTVGDPALIDVTASPDTLALGASTSLSVTVRDAQYNPIPEANIYFGFTAGGNNSSGTYDKVNATTDAQGRVSNSYTAGGTAGTDTLTIETDNGLSQNVTITVDPTTAMVAALTFAVSDSEIVADGTATTMLGAVAYDSDLNVMVGVPVTLTTTYGAITPDTDADPLSETVVTDTSGTVIATLTAPTTVGTAYVAAETSGITQQASVEFVAGPPVAANSTLSVSPGNIPADGTSTATVAVLLRDANSNPVADDTEVTLLTTAGTITSDNPATTVQGRAAFVLQASTTVATETLSLFEVPSLSTTVRFGSVTTADIASIAVSVENASLAVAGVGQDDNTTLTISAYEADGSPIDGETWWVGDSLRVSFVSQPSGGEFLSGTDSTGTTVSGSSIDILGDNGVATVNLQAGTLPGVVEVKVEALDSVTGATTGVSASLPQVNIASGPPHTIALTYPEASSISNLGGGVYRRTGTALVSDRYGNAVPDGTVINLGLVDSVISSSVGNASTASASTTLTDLTATFSTSSIVRNGATRNVEANDRVLLLNAVSADKSRFVASAPVAATTMTVQKSYTTTTAGLDHVVGASLLGATIAGLDSAGFYMPGQGEVSDGQSSFVIDYPANDNTIEVGCYGYTAGAYNSVDTRYSPATSAQVYVVASATDASATAVNQGDFCFAGLQAFALSVVSNTATSGSGVTSLHLEDATTINLPFKRIGSSVQYTTNAGLLSVTACADENGNGACDAGETVSGRTDANGDLNFLITVAGGVSGDSATVTYTGPENTVTTETVTIP